MPEWNTRHLPFSQVLAGGPRTLSNARGTRPLEIHHIPGAAATNSQIHVPNDIDQGQTLLQETKCLKSLLLEHPLTEFPQENPD